MRNPENHRTHKTGWLRAAVLGANDGIISTASLVIGVAASNATKESVLVAGIAGLVAGAMSMATGEYVSVSSQADTEQADLVREQHELLTDVDAEHEELSAIYVARGLEPKLAIEVAHQLMAHDALGTHARDELGINALINAKPVQAALTSAATFTIGALLPLITIWVTPQNSLLLTVAITTLFFLALLGGASALIGGSGVLKSAIRVVFWGALAMAITALAGSFFDTTT